MEFIICWWVGDIEDDGSAGLSETRDEISFFSEVLTSERRDAPSRPTQSSFFSISGMEAVLLHSKQFSKNSSTQMTPNRRE